MKKIMAGFFGCLIVWTTAVFAQENKIPPEVLRGIADDLAVLQKLVSQTSTETSLGLPSKVMIKADAANVRDNANLQSPINFVAKKGETFPVVGTTSGWYAIKKGKDQGWLAKAVAEPVQGMATDESMSDLIYRKIVEQVSFMKEKYKNNPYVSITGFNVSIGITPSVSVNFNFK